VRAQRIDVDPFGQEPSGGAANEQPVLHPRRFLTSRHYARRIRTLLCTGLVAAALFAVAGCGGESDETQAPPATTTTTTTATTATDGIDPLADAGTEPVEGEPSAEGIALLERVAVGRHEGFDRVVFQFTNHVPGYRVEYVEPPLKEDGSGNVVRIKGNHFVVVRMEQASGFDLTVPEGELVYKGPRRIDGAEAGTSVVREVVRIGDFEAVLSWAIGLEDRVDFRVLTASSPARLIVDFRNH
jgi:hypothetical protein